MGRPEKYRLIDKPPLMKGYKPFGIPISKLNQINLSFEEYEAIRLVIYENLQQKEAAISMNISRPTLTRIYNRALNKVATAFIEGSAIIFEGGNYKLSKNWHRCKKCFSLIEVKHGSGKCDFCVDLSGQ